ncbi:APC family permease [Treponema primitia]|uniref:APC family permease n=1 Tax=Treponema primitia TaxID=88058 RepID=UPI00025551B4|nr:APC family permease [Treponema primitia]
MAEEKKGLGLISLVALAAGQVIGAGVVTLIGAATKVTGSAVWLSYGTAVIMGFFIILPYLILSSMIRIKGGSYTFVATLLGETWGGLFGMAFTMNVFATGMIGLGFGQYFNALFPGADVRLVAVITISVFFVFNLLGVNFMSKIQNVLSATLICGLLLFIFTGVGKVDSRIFNLASPGYFSDGSKGFFAAVVLLVYSCYGYSFVVAYSKEAKNPKRDVPYAMLITAGIILILYSVIALVAAGVLPIDEVAGKPLTAVAQRIMPLPLYYAFVVGGPLMAIATTLNSSFTVFARPFHQMTDDGWFPRGLARTNRFGSPFLILTIIYLIAILPIICGFSIQMITTNTVLIGRIADVVAIIAVITLPVRLPEAWENRYFKRLSKPVFYGLMSFSLLVTFVCIVLSFNNMAKTNVAATIGLAVIFLVYAILREKTGKVKMQKSYELQ